MKHLILLLVFSISVTALGGGSEEAVQSEYNRCILEAYQSRLEKAESCDFSEAVESTPDKSRDCNKAVLEYAFTGGLKNMADIAFKIGEKGYEPINKRLNDSAAKCDYPYIIKLGAGKISTVKRTSSSSNKSNREACEDLALAIDANNIAYFNSSPEEQMGIRAANKELIRTFHRIGCMIESATETASSNATY